MVHLPTTSRKSYLISSEVNVAIISRNAAKAEGLSSGHPSFFCSVPSTSVGVALWADIRAPSAVPPYRLPGCSDAKGPCVWPWNTFSYRFINSSKQISNQIYPPFAFSYSFVTSIRFGHSCGIPLCNLDSITLAIANVSAKHVACHPRPISASLPPFRGPRHLVANSKSKP